MTISENLRVTIIQSDLIWENPTENRARFETKIQAISSATDLIVLPEMFTTGFTMNAQNMAQTMDGATVKWMQKIAKEKQVAIVGSLIISENNKYYNRLLFVHSTGNIEFYDKRHTFTLAGEHEVFSAGKQRLIVNYKGWKICPLICYDLRFPVWSRNTENYDLLLYVANWPKPRINAWDTLLQARAVENMSYTIGVNRVGNDKKGLEYTGNSAIIDSLGNLIERFDDGKEHVATFTIDKNSQDKWREKFQFLEDRDSFEINN